MTHINAWKSWKFNFDQLYFVTLSLHLWSYEILLIPHYITLICDIIQFVILSNIIKFLGCNWLWGKTESVIWQNISTKTIKKLRTKGCLVSIFEVRTIDYSLFPKHFNAVKQIFTIHFKLQMLWWAVMDEGLTKMTFSDSVLQSKFHQGFKSYFKKANTISQNSCWSTFQKFTPDLASHSEASHILRLHHCNKWGVIVKGYDQIFL